MKKGSVIIIIVLLLILAVIGYRYLPVIWPGLYFAHEMKYRQFSVQADQHLNRGIRFLLEEATARVQFSPLYSEDKSFHVFLCYRPKTYDHFARQMHMDASSQGFTIEPLGYLFLNLREIGDVGQRYGKQFPYSLLSGKASHILAHELTHTLITDRLGYFGSRNLAGWKREGYAEYVASGSIRSEDSTYSLVERVSSVLNGQYGEVPPARRQYIRDQLVVEYLLDIRDWSLLQLINSPVSEDEVYREMVSWARSQ
ncbi:MAG: hypothetical protein R3281_17160 [Balneolaceae bacterium]|nr:hypothetical protein [Balneolaceae bacterium]